MEETDLLSIVNLDFDYARKQVLKGVSFAVQQGTICGLLGPNASGKSTLHKCINGVLKPKAGYVSVCGTQVKDLSRSKIARLMAVVPQQMTVVFAFTALEMVVMGRAARLEIFRLPSRKDYVAARRCLDELGIVKE